MDLKLSHSFHILKSSQISSYMWYWKLQYYFETYPPR